MANLRVVYDNAANSSTISASTTAGSLAASNLLTDVKAEVWRSTGTSASVTLTWVNSKTISCVSLPFSNLSAAATMNVKVYTNAADGSPAYQTGNVLCSIGTSSTNPGVNQLAFGGGTYATVWLPPVNGKKVVVDISDSGNSLGYLEAAKIVVGNYWTPEYNAEYDAAISIADRSTSTRTDAGDLYTERGSMSKTLSFDLQFLSTADRNQVWNIMRSNGTFSPVFVSLIPESTDDYAGEQMYQVYGKLSNALGLAYRFINQFSTTIEIEEV